jgi:hypothetical protein
LQHISERVFVRISMLVFPITVSGRHNDLLTSCFEIVRFPLAVLDPIFVVVVLFSKSLQLGCDHCRWLFVVVFVVCYCCAFECVGPGYKSTGQGV